MMKFSCGLYRTKRTVVRNTTEIIAPRLVYFHDHSEQGPPIMLLPEKNQRNRWSFHKQGYLLEGEDLATLLEPLKPEGLVRLREHFHPDQGRVVAQNALAQLGYNQAAEAILFFPEAISDKNGFTFSDRGMRIPLAVYQLLEPLVIDGPVHNQPLH